MKEPLLTDNSSTQNSPVIAVIGPSRCGKDTVARLLRQQLNLKYVGSVSWWCKEYVASLLGLPVQEAWETRNDGDNGALWGRLIDQRRVGDPGCILREMLAAGAQIIPGIRKRAEFGAVRDRFTHVIWVERPGAPVDKTLDLTIEDANYVIQNDEGLHQLEVSVELFIERLHDQGWRTVGVPSSKFQAPSSKLQALARDVVELHRPDPAGSSPRRKDDPSPSGPWVQTVSGKRFYLLDPRPEMITIEDIAHALGQLCRFTGHTRKFLSVAEHSVTVSHLLKPFGPAAELAGLLHDAAEAYIGDVNNPLKVALRKGGKTGSENLSHLDEIEHRIKDVLAAKFGVDFQAWKEVGQVADLLALKHEAEHLCGGTQDWTLPAYTQWHGANIVVDKADKYCWFSGLHFRHAPACHAPADASRKFIERFSELSQLK
jgi:uncharacterized protein